jgi:predicted DNA-binding transcriptional regulator AlpA
VARNLIKTRQFAEMIDRPEPTIRWWRATGFGPQSVRIGRTVYYDLDEVNAWIESFFAGGGDA